MQKSFNIEYDAGNHRIYQLYFVFLFSPRSVFFLFPSSEFIQENANYNTNYHSQKRAYKYRDYRPPPLLGIKRRKNLLKLCLVQREDRIHRHSVGYARSPTNRIAASIVARASSADTRELGLVS